MTKEKTAKQKEKIQHILDAAVVCFAKKGFHSTTTAEICREAGMSPGHVFHYFSSKQEIIEAIAENDRVIFADIFAENVNESKVVDSIVAIIRAVVKYITVYHISARLCIEINAEATRNPEIMKIFLENEKWNKKALTDLITIGIQNGEVAQDLQPGIITDWLFILTNGILCYSVTDQSFDWEVHTDFLEKIIRKTLSP
ncbi:TetR/AcrR family transcriptional regulator [Wohlfahrtiimonas populi]|uniref:TetR/AcrR family transcriptional regulator n=1 Tax=Wohlfahrtiimonas populi TaxID=1940240 RepID=UPI0013016295|nr:TetR/AcrR family transcriptional regulator [Wohlfahrtiimonas populi]